MLNALLFQFLAIMHTLINLPFEMIGYQFKRRQLSAIIRVLVLVMATAALVSTTNPSVIYHMLRG